MTKILIDRATAEQTLEALDSENPDIQLKAALALRTALEQQQAKPVQEPVAWITPDGEGFRIRFSPPTSEVPLGWDALYTTPPLPVQPEPSSECNPQDLCAGCRCKYGAQPPLPVQEPVSMRMPKVGDKVICLEDESLGEVVSLTAGGSPDILFADGSRGTYLLHEFAELFGYVTSLLPVQEDAFEGWVKIDEVRKHFDAVGCGTIYKHGGEGRVLLRAAPPKREWVGLTEEEIKNLELTSATSSDVRNISAELKERNG